MIKIKRQRHSGIFSLRIAQQGERKYIRNPIWFFLKEQEIGFRINPHFCQNKKAGFPE